MKKFLALILITLSGPTALAVAERANADQATLRVSDQHFLIAATPITQVVEEKAGEAPFFRSEIYQRITMINFGFLVLFMAISLGVIIFTKEGISAPPAKGTPSWYFISGTGVLLVTLIMLVGTFGLGEFIYYIGDTIALLRQ